MAAVFLAPTRAAQTVAAFVGEIWPTLIALAGSALITCGIAEILGRGAAMIVAGAFLLCIVGWRPLAALVLNGLATVTERNDA